MGTDKGKKSKVAEPGAEGEETEHIDGELVLSIEKLQEVQDELEKINEEASEKVFEVEQKYNEVRRPVYVRRADIIKDIPDFWLTAEHIANGNGHEKKGNKRPFAEESFFSWFSENQQKNLSEGIMDEESDDDDGGQDDDDDEDEE
ncbi:NAP1-related protein 2 [Canna indica]|uniref:NAP1-related protein 2 n=1 Tax=Canna indica TaxID=4628 RepID=A0AAQ3JXD2_9LILI|nr:NAP1-related protein 2 [Canna indica]